MDLQNTFTWSREGGGRGSEVVGYKAKIGVEKLKLSLHWAEFEHGNIKGFWFIFCKILHLFNGPIKCDGQHKI